MAEQVTLEFLSRQCDRLIAELQSTRDGLREIREIIQRCIVKTNETQQLMDEFLSLPGAFECD
jgi:hypothetical protein